LLIKHCVYPSNSPQNSNKFSSSHSRVSPWVPCQICSGTIIRFLCFGLSSGRDLIQVLILSRLNPEFLFCQFLNGKFHGIRQINWSNEVIARPIYQADKSHQILNITRIRTGDRHHGWFQKDSSRANLRHR